MMHVGSSKVDETLHKRLQLARIVSPVVLSDEPPQKREQFDGQTLLHVTLFLLIKTLRQTQVTVPIQIGSSILVDGRREMPLKHGT